MTDLEQKVNDLERRIILLEKNELLGGRWISLAVCIDITGGAMTDLLGPPVTVVRELDNGNFATHTMPAMFAMWMLMEDDINGGEVRRAWIDWGEVNARAWDMSI